MRCTLHSIASLILFSAGLTKCEKQRKKALKMIEDDVQDVVAPICTETGAYERKQCYLPNSCTCVRPKNGKPTYKRFQIPRGEAFDCTSEYIFRCFSITPLSFICLKDGVSLYSYILLTLQSSEMLSKTCYL